MKIPIQILSAIADSLDRWLWNTQRSQATAPEHSLMIQDGGLNAPATYC